jgi:glucuronoarabinoxylan endo-1,4-beta-xylanase
MKINQITPIQLTISILLILFSFGSCSKNNDSNTDPGTPPVVIPNAEVTILADETHQVIRGFGCATAFNPPSTTAVTPAEFDRLFGKGEGQVGLTYLRIRVGTDADVTWRNTELNYSKEVVSRGGKIIACPWTPPARFKTNNSLIGGSLIVDSSAAYAKYLNDFALYMAANGAPLYAISVQNEPDYNPTYEGCVWSATQMRDFLKNFGNQITATKLMAADLVNNNQGYMTTILNDNDAVANTDIFSTHIYGGGVIDNPLIRSKNKEIWMTEHLDTNISHIANLGTALEIHNCFTKANFSAYIWWYGKRFYGPIAQDGQVTKRGFFISQFARFIPEESVRIGTTEIPRNDLFVSAYKKGDKKVIVVINQASIELKLKLIFKNASAGTFIPYTTSQTVNAQKGTQITASNNEFIHAIPARGVATFVEQ